MKTPGPLPESLVPYAERFFACFPEVLVSLGAPNLSQLFELPPHPTAHIRVEETGEYKLVQIKLRRRARSHRSNRGCSDSLSPFSKSRALLARRTPAGPPAEAAAPPAYPNRSNDRIHIPASAIPQPPAPPERPAAPAPAPAREVPELRVRGPDGKEVLPGPTEVLTPEVRGPRLEKSPEFGSPWAMRAKPRGEVGAAVDAAVSDERVRTDPPLAECPPPLPAPEIFRKDRAAAAEERALATGPLVEWRPPTAAAAAAAPEIAGKTLVVVDVRDVRDVSDDTDAVVTRQPTQSKAFLKRQGSASLKLHDPGSPRLASPGSHDQWGDNEKCSSGFEPWASHTVFASAPSDRNGQSSASPDTEAASEVAAAPNNPKDTKLYLSESFATEDNPDCSAGEQEEAERASQSSAVHTPQRTAKPLSTRRGLVIGMSDDWRRGSLSSSDSKKEVNVSPKLTAPAVICKRPPTEAVRPRKAILQPLPGAFPHARTMIFMDWDDTLCPTSWIRNMLKEHMKDQWEWAFTEDGFAFDWMHQLPAWFGQPLPDLPDFRESLQKLQASVIELIKVAQTLGVVCIVTNAVDGWVSQTTKKWLKELKPYILGHGSQPTIKQLYGQQEYRHPPEGSVAANLSWVNELGELMWWKKAAMHKALENIDNLYRLHPTRQERHSPSNSPKRRHSVDGMPEWHGEVPVSWAADHASKRLLNVLSIGDNEAEMFAPQLAVLATSGADMPHGTARSTRRRRSLSSPAWERSPGRPWLKHIKLGEHPDVDQMITQLDGLRKALPQVVAAQSHLRLKFDDLQAMAAPPPEGDADLQLQRALRTQTV